jgi:hypothetical protein
VSIAAGTVALVVAVASAAHTGSTPPRTEEQRVAHHQRVVHHHQVVKQRIRARQHPVPTPTPVPTPAPPEPTRPAPVKPTPVAIHSHTPTRQVVVSAPRKSVKPLTPKSAARQRPPVRHHQAAQRVPVERHQPRPELTAAPAVVARPVVRAPADAAGPAQRLPAIVEVPRDVVQYAQRQVASMLPAVQIGFGVLCALGLLMMGYAVAIGRRRSA